jgi:glycerol-3-phosphate acyltransferase PlsY
MTPLLPWILGGLAAYLLGAVPFGFLIARSRGVDIRQVGSGNIGATNVFRSVSKPLGILTFALDVGKGLAGCTVIPWLAAWAFGATGTGDLPFRAACGALAVVGHNWPVFLGFRGGKGVATSAGLLLGLAPLGCAWALLAWTAVFVASRYVSVASIAAAACLGAVAWPLYHARHGWWFPAVLDLLALVAVWRHRANLRRLRAGTESRFDFRRRR